MQYSCSAEKFQTYCRISLSILSRAICHSASFIAAYFLLSQVLIQDTLAETGGLLEPVTLPSAQVTNPTILPTDIVPLAGPAQRSLLSDDFQITLLNRLPSRFYFNGSCESSFRLETNPFQTPSRSSLILKATNSQPLYVLSTSQRVILNQQLSQVNVTQQIFRVLPSLTAGWYLTPSIRVYSNYFLIRDSALHTPSLNTTVQSISMGIQKDISLPPPFSLQADFQGRELYQTSQIPVFDYIPSLTLTYAHSMRTVAFTSALLQLRGRQPFVSPNREIDPFYSFGVIHRRGQWSFSAYATFVQNFRQPFGGNAYIPVNNYAWIADFEIARTISKRIPAQIFLRAEPVFNFHSDATPGISGNDFRLFYGLRMQISKPSLLPARSAIEQELKQMNKFKTIDDTEVQSETPSKSLQDSGSSSSTPTGQDTFKNIDAAK